MQWERLLFRLDYLASHTNMAILIQAFNEKAEIKVVRVASKRVFAIAEKKLPLFYSQFISPR